MKAKYGSMAAFVLFLFVFIILHVTHPVSAMETHLPVQEFSSDELQVTKLDECGGPSTVMQFYDPGSQLLFNWMDLYQKGGCGTGYGTTKTVYYVLVSDVSQERWDSYINGGPPVSQFSTALHIREFRNISHDPKARKAHKMIIEDVKAMGLEVISYKHYETLLNELNKKTPWEIFFGQCTKWGAGYTNCWRFYQRLSKPY
ncbi:MAG: hypothetical protein UU80_C0021G0035 [candidate division WWE3 bacterium GW2011_GWA1_41_8]|uniref:Uncharacterized protein n=1 Tax=candidate division WWE3 bacterium GW2011_GWA1_41_8 TaxID=1619103 RepID=A0A0G0X9V0_UNCKA|nr:MAG: hypothetical protein UU80_C0021G0035 [candidate division WWE3 bacterium GW2011_GWA1_41_8]